MQFLTPSQVPGHEKGRSFRSFSWIALAAVAAVMFGGALVAALMRGGNPVVFLLPALVGCLFLALALLRWRACARPTNWILRQADNGLYINLRSFLNYHLPPEDETVLFLPAHEIAAVGKVYQKLVCPARHGSTVHHSSFIALYLTHEETGPIEARLRQERRRIPHRALRKKTLHYPVRLGAPGEIRLLWDWVRPAEDRALHCLAAQYPLAPNRKVASAAWESISEEEKADRIVRLWEEGYVDEARALYKFHHHARSRDIQAYFDQIAAR
ncbi:MAG: hypothetical protein IT368_12575 [Candidatus Hydrogenedentes bacterium]|nr:hypothetical protein [Candidatus Hydrogenedentota bacterium]